MTESVVVVSDDLKHDVHAVKTYGEAVLERLKKKRGLNVLKIVKISDGAGAHFKNPESLLHIYVTTTHTMRKLWLEILV